MAKGSIAKENWVSRAKIAFGSDYLGTDGKKYYFKSEENGETIQIAVALTCPKTDFAAAAVTPAGLDFTDEPAAPISMSDSEKATLNRLMNELGL